MLLRERKLKYMKRETVFVNVKMLAFPNSISYFNAIPVKIPAGVLKQKLRGWFYMELQRTCSSQKNFGKKQKKKKGEDLHYLNSRLEATVKTGRRWRKDRHRSVGRVEPRGRPVQARSVGFWQTRGGSTEKGTFSANSVETAPRTKRGECGYFCFAFWCQGNLRFLRRGAEELWEKWVN